MNMMFWEDKIEQMPREDLEGIQLERLRITLSRASGSDYYRSLFSKAGLEAGDIKGLENAAGLPLTTKEDLREGYPYGFLTTSRENLVRLHSSSGTTGNPTVIFHTREDIDDWTNLVARCLYMVGVRPGDVFQNMMGYGLFTGGLGLHYGAERLGALTIPAGSGNSRRQVRLMKDFQTTVIHIIPSYALRLSEVFMELAIDPGKDLPLRIALLGAEPHTEGIRKRVEGLYGLEAYNSYGLSEMNGPGVAFECPEKKGMHLWEDSYLMEVIDPVSLKPLPDGEEGELVLTNLTRQGMPLIRYRTKDLTRIMPGECPCGRSHRRIERIKGRTDDMLIIKGVNIYPIQVERVLMGIPGVGHNYLITLSTENYMDQMKVSVEIEKEYFTGNLKALEDLRRRITTELRDEILVTPSVDLVEPGGLPQSEGKAVRVVDNREK